MYLFMHVVFPQKKKKNISFFSSQVALKTLIVIHRALREVDHSFCEELIYHNKSRGHVLNLLHFKDDSSPSGNHYSLTCINH